MFAFQWPSGTSAWAALNSRSACRGSRPPDPVGLPDKESELDQPLLHPCGVLDSHEIERCPSLAAPQRGCLRFVGRRARRERPRRPEMAEILAPIARMLVRR